MSDGNKSSDPACNATDAVSVRSGNLKAGIPADLPEDELIARAKESAKVQAHLNGGEIRQTIVVPRKLVNLVVR